MTLKIRSVNCGVEWTSRPAKQHFGKLNIKIGEREFKFSRKYNYARRPVSMKGDKALFELRLWLLKMKRDQIQGLYGHKRKSSEEDNPGAWPVANSLHKLPASGMQ